MWVSGVGVRRGCIGGSGGHNLVLEGTVVNIEVQLVDVDGGGGASGRCHAATTVPTAAPTWAVAPAGIVGTELLFSADSSLITDKEVRGVGIGFGQTLLGQLGFNSVGDLLLHEWIWLIRALNVNPLVRFEFTQVGFAFDVITHILRHKRRTPHEK